MVVFSVFWCTLCHSLEPDVRCTLWCSPHCEASGRNSQFFNVKVSSDPEIDSCVAFESRFVSWCTAHAPAPRFEPASVLIEPPVGNPWKSLWFGRASCGYRGKLCQSLWFGSASCGNRGKIVKDTTGESRVCLGSTGSLWPHAASVSLWMHPTVFLTQF